MIDPKELFERKKKDNDALEARLEDEVDRKLELKFDTVNPVIIEFNTDIPMFIVRNVLNKYRSNGWEASYRSDRKYDFSYQPPKTNNDNIEGEK